MVYGESETISLLAILGPMRGKGGASENFPRITVLKGAVSGNLGQMRFLPPHISLHLAALPLFLYLNNNNKLLGPDSFFVIPPHEPLYIFVNVHFYFPLPPPHFSPTLFWVLSHHLNSSSSFLPASPGGHSCLPYNTQDRFPALLRQLRTHAHTHTHPRIHYHHQMLQHALGLR